MECKNNLGVKIKCLHTRKENYLGTLRFLRLPCLWFKTCWAGFLSEQKDEPLAQNELLSMNVDDAQLSDESSTLTLKQTIDGSNNSILNIHSPEAKATGAKIKLDGGVSITDSPNKITLSLRDSDVRQVLRMFADKAGINVAFIVPLTARLHWI